MASQENIRTINMEDFHSLTEGIDYMDEDIAVINSILTQSSYDEPIRLGCVIMGFCIEGCMQVEVNYKTYLLNPGDTLFGLPNSIMQHTMVSPQNKIKLVALSGAFLQRVLKMERETWNAALHLHHNPVFRREERDKNNHLSGFSYFPHLLAAKLADEQHSYHKEVIHHLFGACFCELMGHMVKEAKNQEEPGIVVERLGQSFNISRKFAELLAKDGGKHRNVGYYADALCYSAKHFGKLIKQTTGQTPLEIINARAMDQIKYRLKHSDKSIKEIAEEFCFPNQSFFGKFVKKHLGVSPARYRNMREE